MTKKHKQLILTLLLIPFCLLSSYWCLTSLIRSRDARDVSEQIVSARHAIEKMPPGLERVEEFMRRLRAVNPGHASPEVQQALRDYIAAMEHSLQAMKNHQDAASFEQVCAQKAQALTDAINNK
jgi:hypothetical protein